jgi:probable rRNA maturation factor
MEDWETLVPDILIEDSAWTRSLPRVALIARRAAAAGGGCNAIVLSSDRVVRRLNAQFRGRDKATNVLTFDEDGGQLIFAYGTIRREAIAGRKKLAHHFAHLVVHGTLHLAGYDHHQAGEAREMEMAEARLLARLKIPNPWKTT